jgi:gamma-glutamylcyclotransferase (GGCT)/AIG2-like uncharacterized protein YtfP
MCNLLFVYGTLRRGFTNPAARFLARHSEFAGAGRARGRLYWLGEYPGMRDAQGSGEWVYGEIYRMTAPEETLGKLDIYEGCGSEDTRPYEFARFQRAVRFDSGEEAEAWVYLYGLDTIGLPRIESGDYLEALRARGLTPDALRHRETGLSPQRNSTPRIELGHPDIAGRLAQIEDNPVPGHGDL